MSSNIVLLPLDGTNRDARKFLRDALYNMTGWDEERIDIEVNKFPCSIWILRRISDVEMKSVWTGEVLRIITDALHEAKTWDPKERVHESKLRKPL